MLNLYTAKQAREALALKQARALTVGGKRHGRRRFAEALRTYAGLIAAARALPQGDQREAALSQLHESWQLV